MTRIARTAHLEDQNLTSGRVPHVPLTVAARQAGAARRPSPSRSAGGQLLAEKVTRLPPSPTQVTEVESPDLLPLQA